jgi:hypothetical protein
LGGNGQLWTLGLGLLFTAVAAAYVTRLARVMTFGLQQKSFGIGYKKLGVLLRIIRVFS